MTNNRRRTIADAEQNATSFRKRQAQARREAAQADRERGEQSAGEQYERSEHLQLGSSGAMVDSRAGAGRRAKEKREADKRAGIVRGRPPWA